MEKDIIDMGARQHSKFCQNFGNLLAFFTDLDKIRCFSRLCVYSFRPNFAIIRKVVWAQNTQKYYKYIKISVL